MSNLYDSFQCQVQRHREQRALGNQSRSEERLLRVQLWRGDVQLVGEEDPGD